MDVDIKPQSATEQADDKPAEIGETNGVNDRPPTPKTNKSSIKTRSASSDREKDPAKSVKDGNKSGVKNTHSRSSTPRKINSESKTIVLTLKRLDETPEVTKHEEVKEKEMPSETNGQQEKNVELEQQAKEETNSNVLNGTEKITEEKGEIGNKNVAQPETSTKKTPLKKSNSETIEMDPLVLLSSDEVDPELQFDETSDLESGKGSPIVSRCITRRSHTRNIPTPKTPKSESVATTPDINDQESEKSEEKDEGLNDSVSVTHTDSIDADDLSTRAEVGSDFTRLDYCEHESSNTDDMSYLNASRERSLTETLRNLSSRRTIRPINDDYRKRALKNYQERSDLNYSYSTAEDIQQGLKRKERSETPEDNTKKFKSESPGLISLFASPITNIRSRFSRSDVQSSTPKLTGYKDCNKDIRGSDSEYELTNGIVEEKKSWCSIM